MWKIQVCVKLKITWLTPVGITVAKVGLCVPSSVFSMRICFADVCLLKCLPHRAGALEGRYVIVGSVVLLVPEQCPQGCSGSTESAEGRWEGWHQSREWRQWRWCCLGCKIEHSGNALLWHSCVFLLYHHRGRGVQSGADDFGATLWSFHFSQFGQLTAPPLKITIPKFHYLILKMFVAT